MVIDRRPLSYLLEFFSHEGESARAEEIGRSWRGIRAIRVEIFKDASLTENIL